MILAIDLGGTKLQLGVFTRECLPISTNTVATEPGFLAQLDQLLRHTLQKYPDIEILSLGVPGPVADNSMQGSMPLNCSHTVDFDKELSWLDIPTIVRNDLYMAAHFELYKGAGRRHKNFCMVSLSTGIGVAVVNGGKILDGRLEMGHQVLSSGFEPRQKCINHDNCWASLASGAGIVSRFGTRAHSTTEEIFTHILTSEDLGALKKMNAHAFGNLVTAYDPQEIVVMGSVGLRQFEKIVPNSVEIEAFTINRPIPPITRSSAEGDAGMLGACYAAQGWMAAE